MASLSDLVASQMIPEVMQKLAGLAGISGAGIMFNSPVRMFRHLSEVGALPNTTSLVLWYTYSHNNFSRILPESH